jgi:hypothetical protein
LQPGGPLASSGAYLEIEEQSRVGGLPPSLKIGTPLRVSGKEAYRSDDAGETVLTWSAGDIIVTLRSNALSLDELIKIGESMK